jgi:hypothetical protein
VRDWVRYPPIVERDTAGGLVALGDVHGAYDRLVLLLLRGGLIRPESRSPVKYAWAGGNRLLVCTGDLIDKGDHSLPVLDLFMALVPQAAAAGGGIVVTLGNHEAEFVAKPERKKATPFDAELTARGIAPASLREGKSPYGVWIMTRPLAARVNGWFFAHGGSSDGKTIAQLAESFRAVVDAGTWDAYALVGERSIIEDQKWWQVPGTVEKDLKALGVSHIVFGHDPGATRPKPDAPRGSIWPKLDGKVFAIDVGMTPSVGDSKGALLFIDRVGAEETATALTAEGGKREIWRGPAAVAKRVP